MGYDAVEQIVDEVATNFRGRVVTLEQVVATWKEKLRQLMAQVAPGDSLRRDDAPIRFAASADGDHGLRRQRHRQDDDDRQTGAAVSSAGQERACWAPATRFAPPRSSSSPSGATASACRSSPARPAAIRRASPIARSSKPSQTGTDVCIVDTAGRLQTQKNLMAELTKIQDSIRKQMPEAPHEVLLVLDATTGQNGISQATKFTEAVNCTGIVLAKLDGTAKGGVVVAIRQQVGLPVKYVGVGEKAEDLAPFAPDRFVDALFDEIDSGTP